MGSARIALALAVAEAPLSVDELVEWGLAKPSELFAWVEEARAGGMLLRRDAPLSSPLELSDEARAEILSRAPLDELERLAEIDELVPGLLATARQQAPRRAFGLAVKIYRAVFGAVPPEAHPGGPRGFVDAVVEGIRLYRGAQASLGDILEEAIGVATELGDLEAQAVLLAARAFGAAHQRQEGGARAYLERAMEAADVVGGRVRIEVLAYSAVSLVYSERLSRGIAVFETLLGDVPLDLAGDDGLPMDPDALCVLAVAYSEAGQHPRALDLLHRLGAFGREHEQLPLVGLSSLFLAYLHATEGAFEEAAAFLEPIREKLSSPDNDPVVGWFVALTSALVHASRGLLDEASRAFDEAIAAWRRAGAPPLGLLRHVELLHTLEDAGLLPSKVLDPEREARDAAGMLPRAHDHGASSGRSQDRHEVSAVPLPMTCGLGLRYLALRAIRGSADPESLGQAAELLEDAAVLLAEAGALTDLAATCAHGIALATLRGRADEAARWEARAVDLPGASGRLFGDDGIVTPSVRHGGASEARSPSEGVGKPSDPSSLRLLRAVLDLGSLPVGSHREGYWGAVAARLCERLGVERCALVEQAPTPRLLGARGGTRRWREELLDLVLQGVEESRITPHGHGPGRLVLVPFSTDDGERRGVVALESVHSEPRLRGDDDLILGALGVQLGVLLRNATLWEELVRARERLEQENRYFRAQTPRGTTSDRMVAHSPAMREVLGLIARVAPSDATVLVTGATGVGKELVAHEIHHQSKRRRGPFIAVHIASLAPGLVASALFGHERGAFTGATERVEGRFELADGGTLFLDEVGELSPDDQVKLLRVLQEGTFERVGGGRPLRSDFRLVAATNRDLVAEVRAGRFREDLYFRLATFPLLVPPLAERREEIPTLALMFMERVGRQRGVAFEGIGEADMARLVAWDWPGNVRELEHVIERASLLSDPPRLRIPPLDGGLAPTPRAREQRSTVSDRWPSLHQVERRYVLEVLEHTGGRVTGAGGAAEILALKPSTLNFRIQKLDLVDALAEVRARRAAERRGRR